MIVSTTRFGEIDVTADQIIEIPEGLIGFEGVQQFCLLPHNEESPFEWLQATTNPELAFVVTNPFNFFSDYDFDLSDGDVDELKLQSVEEIAVLSIVTIREDDVTANLIGPIIINRRTGAAKQVVLADRRYTTRHSLVQVPA